MRKRLAQHMRERVHGMQNAVDFGCYARDAVAKQSAALRFRLQDAFPAERLYLHWTAVTEAYKCLTYSFGLQKL